MSVRTQFWILIASVFLTPVLVILTFLTFQLGGRLPNTLTPVAATLQMRQAQMVADWLEAGRPEPGPSEVHPDWVRLAVWRIDGGTPLYQNLDRPELTRAQARTEFDVVLSRFSAGGEDFRVGILSPQGSWQPGGLFVAPELIMLASVSIVIAIISLWILITLKRRLLTLRQATERIAEGDLNTPLPSQNRDDIGTLANSFNEMRKRLKAAMEGRDRLIMSVSHDLKTPLASIKGYTDALRDGVAPNREEEARYIEIIADKSTLLESRIQDLIEFVKLSGSEWRSKRKSENIGRLIEQWFEDAESDLKVNHRTVKTVNRFTPGDQALLDARLMQRALENLIVNALKYGDSNEPIHLVARPDYEDLTIAVGNAGAPLPKADADRLFDPFYRANKSRNQQGLGLGLTVVKTILEQHGGTVTYVHQDGINWFELRWPREGDPAHRRADD